MPNLAQNTKKSTTLDVARGTTFSRMIDQARRTKVRLTITLDMDIDTPFTTAEQQRYFLASIEEALESEAWHELLANQEVAPQQPKNVRARVAQRA
jgi:hypothetical protein